MSEFFKSLTKELSSRAARAMVSQISPANPALRLYLQSVLAAPPGEPSAFLAPPVFEPLFEWERSLGVIRFGGQVVYAAADHRRTDISYSIGLV